MSRRLLAIEWRRTISPLLLPLMVAFPWFVINTNPLPTWFWVEGSVAVRDSVIFIGPLVAGATAWMAGRDRRRGLEDLLYTLPQRIWCRSVARCTATALWGLLAYGIFGLYLIQLIVSRAEWGMLLPWPVLVGALSIIVWATIGYALGMRLSSPLLPAFVAILTFIVQIAVGQSRTWVAFLSPVARVDSTVWYGVRPFVAVPQALFLFGLLLLALSSLAYDERGFRLVSLSMSFALVFIGVGIFLIWRDAPRDGVRELLGGQSVPGGHLVAYTPICTTNPLPVCVHPAYRLWLPDSASTINRLAEPLIGLPGLPLRAEQSPPSFRHSADILGFTINISDPRYLSQSPFYPVVGADIATALVWDQRVPYGGVDRRGSEAQQALALWLVVRVETTAESASDLLVVRGQQARARGPVVDAARRFASLDSARQQDWLREHYADLRLGTIRLEDLP